MSDTDFAKLWTAEFRNNLLARRERVAKSLARLKNRDSTYCRAHELMVRLYDAALSAVDRQLAMEAVSKSKGVHTSVERVP